MFKNKNVFFPITLLIFIALEIFLVKGKQFQIGIFLYLFYAIFLFFIDKKYIITLFVYYLPLLPIIPTDYKILSFVGPHEIIYGFSLFVLSTLLKKSKIKLNKYQKLSIGFVYLLFFINMYVIAKDIFFGLNSDETKGLFYIFKNFVRYYLYYISLVMLIKVIYHKGILDYIIVGIKYSIVTIPISMLFTKALIIMGAGILYDPRRKGLILSGGYERFVGFYGAGGDENSVGIFMVGAFAFLLALYERNGNIKNYIVFMGFAVFGALLTGSRTTFMALATVILIFLITNKSGSTKIAFLFVCVIFYFIFNKQLDIVLQRFLAPDTFEAVDPNSKGRVGKWIVYIEWIMKNPETLLLGNQTSIPFKRAPHNYFIYIIYHVGIFPLIIFINMLIKLIKSIKFNFTSRTLKNVYYILPFPFILMTVNSFGSSIYLWIYLPIGGYYFMQKRITTH